MNSPSELNEILCLIDVFRFTVKQDEINKLENIMTNLDDEADVSSSSSLSSTSARSPGERRDRFFKIVCFDLSSRLSEKKVVEEGDDKPWDKIQQILFERLMIEDYGSFNQTTLSIKNHNKLLLSTNLETNSLGNEFKPNDSQILRYLYGCYYRIQQYHKLLEIKTHSINPNGIDRIKNSLAQAETLILDQVVLYLTEPDLFPDRDKRSKNNQQAPLLLNLVSSYFSRMEDSHLEVVQKFVNAIGETCKPMGDSAYEAIIAPTYARLSQKFVSMDINDASLQEWFNIARVFMQQPEIAKKFLDRNVLKKDNSITYQSTLLGFIISISHLPRASRSETIFFKNPIRIGAAELKFTETQLGIKLQVLGQELHKIFHALLKLPQTRNLFLSWIGRCLHTFKDRKKLWSNQVLMATTTISINDGFLMNFLAVMLHLSEPFAGPYILDSLTGLESGNLTLDKKLLKVDPRYCKWSKMTHENCAVHFLGLSEETFLINTADKSAMEVDSEQDKDVQANFITECFYGTHQAFSYGFRSVYERFYKLATKINDLQQAYADATAASASAPTTANDPREVLKENLDQAMTQFFNLKSVLMVPNRVSMQLHFCIATAAYLNHLVACESFEEALNAKEFKSITLEVLKEKKISRDCLQYIPEMLVENILDFFIYLKHFNDQALARASGLMEPLMTFIITFMGNSKLMQNPHLRARFAEILECLMPRDLPQFSGFALLFEQHPLINELAPSLVNVFVSIEMTGEGVQFEQKFSYRRPMYIVLEYLWSQTLHKQILIELAEEAERDIESARPPLFLRFINLLMNDAIFLLDEALGYMNQLKEAEKRRKTAEWQQLSSQRRAQEEAGFSHIGRLARFHNVLSLNTIGTLAWLTSEIKTIFCHPTLVDRIANMLNYFLEHLVGPKKGKFNVNDKNDYEFKPREILEKICQIYINLGGPEGHRKYREFCTAVSSDGRSYNEHLLPQATDILFRTGQVALGTEFEKLSQLVHKVAVQDQLDEIPTEDIPDTFLDPIMSTLMVDPVLLPSSKIIVDRTTIARHLLSDQTDPFNRSPLSMEDVIPEVDLKNQIECFLRERREAQKQRVPREDDSMAQQSENAK